MAVGACVAFPLATAASSPAAALVGRVDQSECYPYAPAYIVCVRAEGSLLHARTAGDEELHTFIGLVTITLAADGQIPARRVREGRIVSVQGRDGAPRLANEDVEASFIVGGQHCTFRATSRIEDEGLAFDDRVLACD